MHWAAFVIGMQLWYALAWVEVSHRCWPAALRFVRCRPLDQAQVNNALWYWAGTAQLLFIIRWLAFGRSDLGGMSTASIQFWAFCYMFFGLCGVVVANTRGAAWDGSMFVKSLRWIKIIAMWCVVGAMCLGIALWTV